MKILHVCGKKDWGGGENQLLLTLEEMALHGSDLVQFLLCTTGSDIYKKIIENKINIKVITSPKRINLDLRFVFAIFKTVKMHRIDLIHVHDPDAHSLVVLAVDLFRLKTKVVLHKKTIFPIKEKKYSLYKYNHKNIKHIICVSEASKKSIENKIKTIPISVVYDAIRFKKFESQPRNNNEFIILNVANHTRHKNLFTLLDIAYECIHVRKLPFKFIQVGDGKLKDSLMEKHKEMKLGDHFEFKGFLKDVTPCYESANAFLFTSVREGLGVSLLEAIQFQLPIVSSNVGGIPEVIDDGKNGLLCDYDDVNSFVDNLVKIYASEVLVKSLTAQASHKIKHQFSTEIMLEKLKTIYFSL